MFYIIKEKIMRHDDRILYKLLMVGGFIFFETEQKLSTHEKFRKRYQKHV